MTVLQVTLALFIFPNVYFIFFTYKSILYNMGAKKLNTHEKSEIVATRAWVQPNQNRIKIGVKSKEFVRGCGRESPLVT